MRDWVPAVSGEGDRSAILGGGGGGAIQRQRQPQRGGAESGLRSAAAAEARGRRRAAGGAECRGGRKISSAERPVKGEGCRGRRGGCAGGAEAEDEQDVRNCS